LRFLRQRRRRLPVVVWSWTAIEAFLSADASEVATLDSPGAVIGVRRPAAATFGDRGDCLPSAIHDGRTDSTDHGTAQYDATGSASQRTILEGRRSANVRFNSQSAQRNRP